MRVLEQQENKALQKFRFFDYLADFFRWQLKAGDENIEETRIVKRKLLAVKYFFRDYRDEFCDFFDKRLGFKPLLIFSRMLGVDLVLLIEGR